MIKEVEVKARVKNKSILLKKIKSLGIKLSKPITQRDRVFLPIGTLYENIGPGTIALRIREENNKTLFTLKQRQEVELSTLEKELEIGDKKTLGEIIIILGFYEWVKINKKRSKAKYNNYEICIDEVQSLGTYIEVEKMTRGDSKKTQEELFIFLETLGIKREERERRGYDTLCHFKKLGQQLI